MTDQSVDNKNTKKDKLILVGFISKAHGIKGQVVVKSYTDPPENIVNLPIFDQEKNQVILKLVRLQPNGHLICNLENCHDRNTAETLVKRLLYCLRGDLPQDLEEDEFYIQDLIGLKVVDNERNHIGMIINVANYGGGDIIEVKLIDEKDSQMIPFTMEFFPEIGEEFVVLGKRY